MARHLIFANKFAYYALAPSISLLSLICFHPMNITLAMSFSMDTINIYRYRGATRYVIWWQAKIKAKKN